MALKAVLFDLDGVLVDTEGIYSEFWGGIDRMYPTGVENFAEVIKGNTLANILGTYFPDEDVRGHIVEMLAEQEHSMQYRFFDGALELLGGLREAGVRNAIVTSSNLPKMKHLFSLHPCLNELVDTLVTDEDVTASKPDPQGYLLAARRLGAGEGEFVVVEDSMAGLEAGRRSGAYVIGIATTNPMEKVKNVADMAVEAISGLAASDIISLFK